jgi:orotate phosphoribosyltransferase
MNYRSIDSLNRLVLKWQCRLPRDFDVIVGIPRSGMLVANLLALHLNLPMTDVAGLLNSRLITFSGRSKAIDLRHPRKVLVVDDALSTGRQLTKLKQRLADAALPHEIYYGVAYVRPGVEPMIDYFGEHLPDPQLFEWNMMHHPVLLGSCLDIDGVLCEDPAGQVDDDGERYCRFLETAAPMVIPTMPVGWLVTARLDKYRSLTEQWLAKHGVQYRSLVMWDLPDRTSREGGQSHGEYKANVYRATGADLFIESSPTQAIEIAGMSGRQVFCMATGEMVTPAKVTSSLLSDPVKAAFGPNPGLADRDDWTCRMQAALMEFLRIVPPGATAIVIDDWQWGMAQTFAGRKIIHFVEREGLYLGPPVNDASAIDEFEHARAEGATHAIIGWPSLWWRDNYVRFYRHITERYACALENSRMIAFDLRVEPGRTPQEEGAYA